jgi:hypothetical protein
MSPSPSDAQKKMQLARDVPCFSGVVRQGTSVTVVSVYEDANGEKLANIRAGFIEIFGLSMDALKEHSDPF